MVRKMSPVRGCLAANNTKGVLEMSPSDRNGADPEEWAEDLLVREIPKTISFNASCSEDPSSESAA